MSAGFIIVQGNASLHEEVDGIPLMFFLVIDTFCSVVDGVTFRAFIVLNNGKNVGLSVG